MSSIADHTCLRKNPITAPDISITDFKCFFFQHLILSKSSPLGKVTCYFQRTEFQLRGSPHTHIALWVENAPQLDTATEDEITSFIDNYVTCALPPEDHPLNEHVNEKQRHSHSVACKKHSNNCRFHYL